MKKKIVIILSLLFLGAILLWAVVILKTKNLPPISTTNKVNNSQGKIYLTLKNKKNNNWGIYYFDLTKKELKNLYTDQSCNLIGGEVNKDNMMPVITSCAIKDNKVFQISINELDNTKETQKMIPGIFTYLKRGSTWSLDNQHIAFMEAIPQDQQKGKLADIDKWRIFVSDLTGKKQFVASAIHPFFSPDNQKILALRKEGVFLFNIKEGTGKSLYLPSLKKDFPFNMKTILELSSQKDKLLLANPANKSLFIYQINFKAKDTNKTITGVESINLKENHILAAHFSSADENYLVTIETTPKGENDLVWYDIANQKRKVLTKLNNYSQFQINDWK